MEPKGQQVELGKETRKQILDALKNIKSQISQAKHRESTATDVAADVLASGGGPIAAAKEALAFRAQKAKSNLKRRLDPLHIIQRMTGSKLATSMAGRIMGRSETSIRSAAGLQAKEESPETVAQPYTHSAEPVASPVASPSSQTFEIMAKSLAHIASRVQDIADKMKATKQYVQSDDGRFHESTTGKFASSEAVRIEGEQKDFLNKIWDELKKVTDDKVLGPLEQMGENSNKTLELMEQQRDAAAEEKYKSEFGRHTPTLMGVKEKPTEKKDSWMSNLMTTLLSSAKSFISMLSNGFEFAAKTLGKFLLSTIKALTGKIGTVLEGVWELLGKLGSIAGKGAMGALGMAKKAGKGILDVGRNILGVPTVPESTPATPPTTGKPPTTAGGKVTAGGKATSVPKRSIGEVIKKQGPKMLGKLAGAAGKSIPFIGAAVGGAMALKSLLSGDKTQAAIDAGAALASATGAGGVATLPLTMAATLANDVYKELYGTDPLSDDAKSERLPEVADAASKYITEFLSSKAEQVPAAATAQESPEVPTVPSVAVPTVPPQPTSGAALQEAADLKRGQDTQAASQVVAPTVNNIRNNNINNSTIHQGLSSPRSSESSFLRYVNKDFVPA